MAWSSCCAAMWMLAKQSESGRVLRRCADTWYFPVQKRSREPTAESVSNDRCSRPHSPQDHLLLLYQRAAERNVARWWRWKRRRVRATHVRKREKEQKHDTHPKRLAVAGGKARPADARLRWSPSYAASSSSARGERAQGRSGVSIVARRPFFLPRLRRPGR